MIKIKIEYGLISGKDSTHGVRVTASNTEFTGSCESVFATPELHRLSEKKLKILFDTFEHNINQCIKGYYGEIPTIAYPKINKNHSEPLD